MYFILGGVFSFFCVKTGGKEAGGGEGGGLPRRISHGDIYNGCRGAVQGHMGQVAGHERTVGQKRKRNRNG